MHSKPKKSAYKFDTSYDNLACFIEHRVRKQDINDPLSLTKSNHLRKKTSSLRKSKAKDEQNEAFLESILAKTFTEEFVGRLEITKLVQQLKISQKYDVDQESKLNASARNAGQVSALTGSEDDYKLIITECLSDVKNQSHINSTRVGTQQTPEKSEGNTYSFSQYSDERYVNPYEYTPVYLYETKNSNQPAQRKRRAVMAEQANQFRINLDRIQYDGRTTLMIRNIPNKYTQQLLLEEFNRNYKVKFDFFYLPIDYNNVCNVGYAFINFIHTKFIPQFYHEFNGKRWSKFNSEKICNLTYARIQGTRALRSHFKNSHVMQKDKRVRPLINTNELCIEHRNNLNRIVQDQRQKIQQAERN